MSALEVSDSAVVVDPACRLTASSETGAEPPSDTDVLPARLIWAVTAWDGSLADQPPLAGTMPETRGAVPRPIGPGPSRAWMARASPVGIFWAVEWSVAWAAGDARGDAPTGTGAMAPTVASIVANVAKTAKEYRLPPRLHHRT